MKIRYREFTAAIAAATRERDIQSLLQLRRSLLMVDVVIRSALEPAVFVDLIDEILHHLEHAPPERITAFAPEPPRNCQVKVHEIVSELTLGLKHGKTREVRDLANAIEEAQNHVVGTPDFPLDVLAEIAFAVRDLLVFQKTRYMDV